MLEHPPSLQITCTDATKRDAAEATAKALMLDVNPSTGHFDYTLAFDANGVRLHIHHPGKQLPIEVELHTGAASHRRKFGGGKGQMIAKAMGLAAGFKPRILDATAGLGGDAFVLASLGCQVYLQERSPVAFALLHDGLMRGLAYAQQQDQELAAVFQRMHLIQGNSITSPIPQVDIIYLDPMFPMRKKSAAINKNMRAFHDVIGNDKDAQYLLERALKEDVCRVVVKRPRIAPHLGEAPHYSLEGKSSRFDIFALKKLPA